LAVSKEIHEAVSCKTRPLYLLNRLSLTPRSRYPLFLPESSFYGASSNRNGRYRLTPPAMVAIQSNRETKIELFGRATGDRYRRRSEHDRFVETPVCHDADPAGSDGHGCQGHGRGFRLEGKFADGYH
jgi:hypothetical protein